MADFLAEAEAVAIKAAREAGKVLLKHFRKSLTVGIKEGNPRSLVTNADKESDAVVRKLITDKFPSHGVVSEESKPVEGRYVWYVDPLDGTTNYTCGVRYSCVSIALAKGDELLVAIIYDPFHDELYTAAKGKGAFLNNKKMLVTNTSKLQQATVYCDFGYEDARRQKTLDVITQLVLNVKSIRMKGSGALEMCEIASGSAECYFHIGSKSWDYAAAALIVREAGGAVTDLHGREWVPNTGEGIIAANKALGTAILEKVRAALK